MKSKVLSTALGALGIAFYCGGCGSGAGRGSAAARAPAAGDRVTYAAEISRAQTLPASQGRPGQAPATSKADDSDEETDEMAWKTITTTLGREGARKDAVLTVRVPRDDLFVAIDGMDVPTAAGVESIFNFWHCSCGKTSMIGQFCVADYESNDVIDALRSGHMEVVSVAPMVLHSRISPLILRFQGEGSAGDLAKTLKAALSWMGKERMAPSVPAGDKK